MTAEKREIRTVDGHHIGWEPLASERAPAIAVLAVRAYGVTRHYVESEQEARDLQTLTGRKTLTAADLAALEALGHDVIITDALNVPAWAKG